MGVPCGKKWASDALVLLRNPVITAPAHRGMAMPRFIDSCVVCATARRAPISAYFELEAQPDQRMEYTARLDMASINRTPRFMLIRG